MKQPLLCACLALAATTATASPPPRTYYCNTSDSADSEAAHVQVSASNAHEETTHVDADDILMRAPISEVSARFPVYSDRSPFTRMGGFPAVKAGPLKNDPVLWADRTIIWDFAPGLKEKIKQEVAEAMAMVEGSTCVRFRQRTDEPHYVRIDSNPKYGCASEVGFYDVENDPYTDENGISYQILNLYGSNLSPDTPAGVGCGVGSTAHELMHAAGMAHEHMRPDRDKFMRVMAENLNKPKQIVNFAKWDYSTFDTKLSYESLMMYGSTRGGKKGPDGNLLPVIVRLDGSTWDQQRDRMALSDIDFLRALYRCPSDEYPRIALAQFHAGREGFFPLYGHQVVEVGAGNVGEECAKECVDKGEECTSFSVAVHAGEPAIAYCFPSMSVASEDNGGLIPYPGWDAKYFVRKP